MRIAGDWSWRILAVLAVVAVLIFLVVQLRLIVIPLMIAVLLAALLVPLVGFLVRHRWPRGLAVAVAELGLIGVVSGLVFLVVSQIRSGFPDLQKRSVQAYEDFTVFLRESPFQISQQDLDGYVSSVVDTLQSDNGLLVNGALSVGSTAGHVLAGLLLVLFSTLFMLIDGRGIWQWVVRLFPRRARTAVDGSGTAGWVTLTTFVRVQIFVAAVDAVGIGLVALFLQLPLTIPIAVAVFLGSFIPVVGAVATGAIAIFIALVYGGPIPALIMLIGVLAVQQLEGHVLQPLVMGTAVKVHPLAVVLAVAAGGFLAGIPGALFAVPVVATINAMITFIASGRWRETTDPKTEEILPHA
jgi:putative heme transporter